MLPLTRRDADADDDEAHLVGASSGGSAATQASLLECIAWGSVAECITSVCCPLIMAGDIDVTATALNLVCPFLGGMAHALDAASSFGGTNAAMHQRASAFQSGFIGVSTSFSFMAEQASLLDGWLHSALYVLATMSCSCFTFAAGRAVLVRVLRSNHELKRALRSGRPVLTSAHLSRVLGLFLALAWAWVLLAPAGAVHDPLAVHIARGRSEPPPPPPTKRGDVLHFVTGLAMQAAGLWVSARIDGSLSASTSKDLQRRSTPQLGIFWGVLLCNSLSCAVLVALRVGEAASYLSADGLVVSKLRTSGCGALSISGGLSALLVAGKPAPSRHAQHAGSSSLSLDGPAGSTRSLASAALNVALHLYVAGLTCVALPWLIAQASPQSPAQPTVS